MDLLTDAVDDIVSVSDFLAVSEAQVLEDVNRCCLALQVPLRLLRVLLILFPLHLLFLILSPLLLHHHRREMGGR